MGRRAKNKQPDPAIFTPNAIRKKIEPVEEKTGRKRRRSGANGTEEKTKKVSKEEREVNGLEEKRR